MRTSYFCFVSVACLLALAGSAVGGSHPAGLLYLSEAAGPRSLAPGGVAATPARGASLVGSNPASGMDALTSGWHMTTLRVPTTRVETLTPAPDGGSTTASTLTRDGYALAAFSKPMRLGERTRLTAEVTYRAAGRFQRVDEDGASVHAFPENDTAAGLALSRRLSERLSVGGGGKWLRSKYSDAQGSGQVGLGWAFDAGVVVRPSAGWRIGVTARNVSNGVSYPDPARPRDPRREVVVGAARDVALTGAATLLLAADVRMPSARGTQGSAGASITGGDRLGASVGYQRRVERLGSDSDTGDGGSATDIRLWRVMGPTAGAWIRLGAVEVSAAVGPTYLPVALADETHAVRDGRWQWSIGVNPAR